MRKRSIKNQGLISERHSGDNVKYYPSYADIYYTQSINISCVHPYTKLHKILKISINMFWVHVILLTDMQKMQRHLRFH